MGRRPWSWPPGEGEGSRRRPAAQKSHRFVLVMESSRDQDGLKAFRMDSGQQTGALAKKSQSLGQSKRCSWGTDRPEC